MKLENQTYYVGPALWVQISDRFRSRMSEWWMCFHTAVFGAVLVVEPDTFSTPIWKGFSDVFGEPHSLGVVMITLGMLRLFGLMVNGAKKTVTPFIRQISAGAGCILWMVISYLFLQSGIMSTWLAIYPLFAVKELVNIYHAAKDQGVYSNGRIAQPPA